MLKQLEIFVAVADEQSFTAAARRLGVAQPWLSVQVRKFEDALGLTMFVRSTRRVELTSDGELLLPMARRVVDDLHEIRNMANSLKRGAGSALRLGIDQNMADWPERNLLVTRFISRYAEIRFDIVNSYPDELFRMLASHEVDMVLAPLPAPSFVGETLRLCVYPLKLLMPMSSPLAQFDSIPLSALKGEKILSIRRGYHDQMVTQLHRFCTAIGIESVAAPDANITARLNLARMLGMASFWITSPHGIDVAMDDMVVRGIEDDPIKLELGLMRIAGSYGPAADKLWKIAREIAAEEDRGSAAAR